MEKYHSLHINSVGTEKLDLIGKWSKVQTSLKREFLDKVFNFTHSDHNIKVLFSMLREGEVIKKSWGKKTGTF